MYLLDEPEAALSPARQLTFLSILHQLASMKVAQFIIATHSPILLTLPEARVISLDEGRLREVELPGHRALSADSRFFECAGALSPSSVPK